MDAKIRNYDRSCFSIAADRILLLLSVKVTSKSFIHSTTVVPSADTAAGGRVDHSSRGTAKKA
jgi:hypothetical protein